MIKFVGNVHPIIRVMIERAADSGIRGNFAQVSRFLNPGSASMKLENYLLCTAV